MKERLYTLEELKPVCDTWQKRLRLQDWDIELIMTDDFKKFGNALAWSRVNAHANLAEITMPNQSIVKLLEWRPTEPPDMLFLLLHELLHIHFDAIFPYQKRPHYNEHTEDAAETAIDMIAKTLLNLHDELEEANERQTISKEATEPADGVTVPAE